METLISSNPITPTAELPAVEAFPQTNAKDLDQQFITMTPDELAADLEKNSMKFGNTEPNALPVAATEVTPLTPPAFAQWEAPDPSTRVSNPQESTIFKPSTAVARAFDKMSRFFSRSAEITDKGAELASRFGSFAGRLALRAGVEYQTLHAAAGAAWQEGGDSFGQRLGHIKDKGIYKVTTLQSDREAHPFDPKKPIAGQYNGFGQLVSEGIKNTTATVAEQVKRGANGLRNNIQDAHVENLEIKAGLRNIEADLLRKGLDKNGKPVPESKDLTNAIAKREFKAKKLNLRADFKKTKYATDRERRLAA